MFTAVVNKHQESINETKDESHPEIPAFLYSNNFIERVAKKSLTSHNATLVKSASNSSKIV